MLITRLRIEPTYAGRTYDDFIDYIHEDGRLPSEKGLDVFFDMGIRAGTYKEKWPRERYWITTYADSYPQWKP